MNLKEKLSEKPYFGIRINVSKSVTLEMIKTFLGCWNFVYACFENADKEVANDHTHIIIWDKGCDSVDFEQNFVKKMKLELKGTKGNHRFAVNHKKETFEQGCLYLSKGKQEEMPHIIANTYFTSPEVEEMWLMYWKENARCIKNKLEDTSCRQIETILRNNKEELDAMLFIWKSENTQMEIYAKVAKFWFDKTLEHFRRDIKEWEDKRVASICSGLMLQTLPEQFKVHKEQKILSMIGLNNFEKNKVMEWDNDYYN